MVRQVYPGPNAIMNAVNASNAGDVLSIHPGTYHERVRLNKRLTLRRAEAAGPVIDGDCATRYTIEVKWPG